MTLSASPAEIRMAARAGHDIDHIARTALPSSRHDEYYRASSYARDRYWARCRAAAARSRRTTGDPVAARQRWGRECADAWNQYVRACARVLIRIIRQDA
jgi:hypothetical protein